MCSVHLWEGLDIPGDPLQMSSSGRSHFRRMIPCLKRSGAAWKRLSRSRPSLHAAKTSPRDRTSDQIKQRQRHDQHFAGDEKNGM
ncbi:hypothetical protein PO124_04290 [Bacillus licheniformis]|nr:hypothetical protein [Bacillus licheniformis]